MSTATQPKITIVENGWQLVYEKSNPNADRACCFVGGVPLCGQAYTDLFSDQEHPGIPTCERCDELNDGLWAIPADEGDDVAETMAIELPEAGGGEP